jgi:hypothetical protein
LWATQTGMVLSTGGVIIYTTNWCNSQEVAKTLKAAFCGHAHSCTHTVLHSMPTKTLFLETQCRVNASEIVSRVKSVGK